MLSFRHFFLGHVNQNQDLEIVKKRKKKKRIFLFSEALNRNIKERKKQESLLSRFLPLLLLLATHIHHIELDHKQKFATLSLY